MKLNRNQINIFNFYINILINLVFVIEKVNYLDSIFDFLRFHLHICFFIFETIIEYYLMLNNFHSLIKIVTSIIKLDR